MSGFSGIAPYPASSAAIKVTNLSGFSQSLCSLSVTNLSLDLCDTSRNVPVPECSNDSIRHLLIQAWSAHEIQPLLSALPNLQSLDLYMPHYSTDMSPVTVPDLILHGSYRSLPAFLQASRIDELVLTSDSLEANALRLDNPAVRVIDISHTRLGSQLRRMRSQEDSTLKVSIEKALGKSLLVFNKLP